MRTISRPDVLVRDFLSRNRPRVAVAAGSGVRRHCDTRWLLSTDSRRNGSGRSSEEEHRKECDENRHDWDP